MSWKTIINNIFHTIENVNGSPCRFSARWAHLSIEVWRKEIRKEPLAMTNYLKNLPFFFYFFLLTETNLIGSVPNAGPISREMAVVGTGLVVRAAPAFLSPAIHGSEDADDGIGP